MLSSDRGQPFTQRQPEIEERGRRARRPAAERPVSSDDIFGLRLVESRFDAEQGAVWSMMRHHGRPSFTPSMLHDLNSLLDGVIAIQRERPDEVRYFVFGSRFPKVFC